MLKRILAIVGITAALVVGTGTMANAATSVSVSAPTQATIPQYPPTPDSRYPVIEGTTPPTHKPATAAMKPAKPGNLAKTGTSIPLKIIWGATGFVAFGVCLTLIAWQRRRARS